MLSKDLEKLGLTKNEAATYLVLQESGKVKAGKLIQETGLHRNLVYQALESLAQKRLLTKSTAGSVALFQATDPSNFLQAIREQELTAERIIEELKERKKLSDQEITIYEGPEGIRAYCLKNASSLKDGQNIHVIGTGGPRLEKAMGSQAMKKYFSLIEKNGGIKVLAYRTQQYTESMLALIRSKPMFQFRILPINLAPAAGVIFTEESVGFVVYEGSMAVIEIRNPHLVEAYKNYFDLLWNQEVKIEQGVDAVKRAFMQIIEDLQPGEEYYSIGTQTGAVGSELALFFDHYHTARVKRGVICKLLSYKTDTTIIRERYHKAGDKQERVSFIKPLSQTATGFIQTILYKNKIVIPIYGENPMVIIFENQQVYDGFKQYFDELWNQDTQTLEGENAVKELCEAVLQENKDLYLIAANGAILENYSGYYKAFTQQRVKQGIHLYMLANESIRNTELTKLPNSTAAYLPKEFESPMVVWVFGDYVANVLWQRKLRIFLTKDASVAESYRQYYSALKKIAKL